MNIKEEWLRNFTSQSTRYAYGVALTNFEKYLGKDLGIYIKAVKPLDFFKDLKGYWSTKLADASPKTVSLRLSTLKTFGEDYGLEIPKAEWSKFRRRKLDSARPVTADRSGTKDEWHKILLEMNTQGRALFMTLLSTGARIGETLQIKLSDLELDADPPKVHIRPSYTKGKGSDRIVFLTQEAKEALLNYLGWRKGKKQRGGRLAYDDTDKVFPMTADAARETLVLACQKARITDRDSDSGRYLIHIHSTRKFFRSNCGLDDSLTHSIMGHTGYLDKSYLRQDPDRAGKEFKRLAEVNLTFFRATGMEQMRRQAVIDSIKAANPNITNEKIAEALRAAGLNDINEGTPDQFAEFTKILGEQSKPEQKVVTVDDIQKYIDKGWQVKMVLNHEKALVERYPTKKA